MDSVVKGTLTRKKGFKYDVQVDFYGYTALHAAAENGHTEMIPLLLGGNKLHIKSLNY
jgi:ankyrin repeat protein